MQNVTRPKDHMNSIIAFYHIQGRKYLGVYILPLHGHSAMVERLRKREKKKMWSTGQVMSKLIVLTFYPVLDVEP